MLSLNVLRVKNDGDVAGSLQDSPAAPFGYGLHPFKVGAAVCERFGYDKVAPVHAHIVFGIGRCRKKHLFDLYCETHDENVDEMYVMHADEQENASALCDMLKAKFPQLNVRMRLLSPIIGAHLGKGLVGVGFYKKTV